jgi:large subunit ribosomal protein L16
VLKLKKKKLYFGFYGLVSLETGRLDSKVVDSLVTTIKREVKLYKGKFWFYLNNSIPVTQIPIGVRMGKGKGNISKHISFVRKGQILCELSIYNKIIALNILKVVGSKLPVKCRIVIY